LIGHFIGELFMAQAWLDRYECDRDGKLPPVCMKCGAEAEHYVKRTFSWYPPWVLATILAGVLPWMVLASVLTKKLTVYVPLCSEHRAYFSRRVLIGGLIILAGVMLTIFGIYVSIIFVVQPNATNARFIPCCGTLFLFCMAMLVASIVMQSGIKAVGITDDDIKLNGVSEGFVEAVRDDRRAKEERRAERGDEDDRPRGRRRDDSDEDDDYEDRRPRRPRYNED
jgi:hypothetical protein